jgi:hypothetical protein
VTLAHHKHSRNKDGTIML